MRAQVDAARAAVARLQLAHLAAQLRVGVVAHPLERLQDLPGALARRAVDHGVQDAAPHAHVGIAAELQDAVPDLSVVHLDLAGAQLARRVPAHGGIGIVCVAQQRAERLAVHGRPSMAAGL